MSWVDLQSFFALQGDNKTDEDIQRIVDGYGPTRGAKELSTHNVTPMWHSIAPVLLASLM